LDQFQLLIDLNIINYARWCNCNYRCN